MSAHIVSRKFFILLLFLGSALAFNESRETREIHRKSNSQRVKFVKENPRQRLGSFTIERNSIAFCQIRIDFDTFESIGQVNKYGKCQGGQWTLNGQIQDNVPTLCGYNTGQHVYADFEEMGRPMTMNITTDNDDAQWEITVTQIACDDEENRVSTTCLQSYKSVNGNFQSFNYQNIQTNSPPGESNISALPIRTIISASAVVYHRILRSGTLFVAEYGAQCTTDYLVIPSGTFTDVNGVTTTSNLFCGLGFGNPVTTTYKPFQIQVVTDSTEAPLMMATLDLAFFINLS
ncbi:hypothetical protein Anas_12691 [Armadillidium nasatum]|uniref:CUB domain-containing protein n=1 Tax=Armadillidium nasatum TaxID=96803 RepID=A0A5N5T8E2_9CRUS|nr:hypothetical protein Anas_12691 [Armadillidium nasatum]